MQRGEIISNETGEYDQAAYLFARLASVASDPLRADLLFVRDLFTAVGRPPRPHESSLSAFEKLTRPELIDAEQRIADHLSAECGAEIAPPTTSSATGDESTSICPGWRQLGNIYTHNRFPFILDTSGANYWNFVTKLTQVGWIEIHGQYPHARYFSILPNDFQTNNLQQLTDVHILPDPGSANPFRGPLPPGTARYYTVRYTVTAPPPVRNPNTSYIGVTKDGTDPNPAACVVYRIYGSDFGSQPNSGGVPLPAVTVYAPDGHVTQHFDECDPYPDGPPSRPQHVARFPTLPIPGPLAQDPPALSFSSNYHLPIDLLANPDVQYMTAYYSHRFGQILVARAKAFSTPHTAAREPVYTPGRDIRGWTICGYNFYAGYANGCILDHEAPVDADGYYTIVVSTVADRPTTADPTHGVTWIDWGPYLDGQLTWRLFLKESPLLQELAAAIHSGHSSPRIGPYIPSFTYCSAKTFEGGGWAACRRA